MSQKTLIHVLAGSHLYGTNLPESDKDVKLVFRPSGAEILLGSTRQINSSVSETQDSEIFPVQRFLELVTSGQTVALDLLFAPETFYLSEPTFEWREILRNRDLLVSKNVKSFAGYCRQQSAKYAVKAERFEAVSRVVETLKEGTYAPRKNQTLAGIHGLVDRLREISFVELKPIVNAQGKEIEHLSVCDTLIPVTAKIGVAYQLYQGKLEKYGERVRKSQNMGNKDWKALYHAVRVAEQALELLNTGKITFPRPERDYLLAIRQGKVPHQEISDLLETNLERIEVAQVASKLPEEADQEIANSLARMFHLMAVEEDSLEVRKDYLRYL